MNNHDSKLEPAGRAVIRCAFLRPAWLAPLFLLGGCAGVQPPPSNLATADIGPTPTGYEAPIRAYFAPQLKDPYSAVYQFEAPVRAWTYDHVTWVVCGTVNAKNSLGEYVGAKPFIAFFFPNGGILGAIDTHEYKTRVSPAVEKCAEWRAASPDASSPATSPPWRPH
jgi:hypothetical protein